MEKKLPPHLNATYAVRRVFLRDEAEQIFNLQADAEVFRRHYPEHAKWLRMAIDEIVAGRRVAFGVYVPEVRSGMAVADLKLAGSIIVKSESYSKVMQLKNLYIDESHRRRHLGMQLFQAVERFCVKRGSTAIDTEVGNGAIRQGKWKLVSAYPDWWELYDMETDRTEMHNLADQHPDRVKEMAAQYKSWAKRVGVEKWPLPGMSAIPTAAPEYLKQDAR